MRIAAREWRVVIREPACFAELPLVDGEHSSALESQHVPERHIDVPRGLANGLRDADEQGSVIELALGALGRYRVSAYTDCENAVTSDRRDYRALGSNGCPVRGSPVLTDSIRCQRSGGPTR
jgi:hypothetical protein